MHFQKLNQEQRPELFKSGRQDNRIRYRAAFKRYGQRKGYVRTPRGSVWVEYETVLILDVRDARTGKLVADHLWFKKGKRFAALGDLKDGDEIEFDARAGTYIKCIRDDYGDGWLEEYGCLKYPTKLQVVKRNSESAA